MNRLRLAQQGFDSLAPWINSALNEVTSDWVEEWLRDEVCPVVEELVHNQSFRLAAIWSVNHLSRGADTPERRLVEEVDRVLVQYAVEIASAIRDFGHSSQVDQRESLPQRISAEDRRTLELIASRPWFDLVKPDEFFQAEDTLHLNVSSSDHLSAFRQRELRVPLGDYVARSMFARIDYWKAILDRLGYEVIELTSTSSNEAWQASNRLFNLRIELNSAVTNLNAACNRDQDLRRREACTALTLVYTGYARLPQLEWLGSPPSWWQASAPMIRSCIRRRGVIGIVEPGPARTLRIVEERTARLCDPVMVRQIAASLHDVAALYELPEDPDDLIEWAQDRARLVLVDRSPREVFWDHSSVTNGSWDTSPVTWNLLWVLADNAGRVVDQGMLQSHERHGIRSRRARLAKQLVDYQGLDALIENVRGHGYRLGLESDDILLLRDNGLGRLENVCSRRSALS